MALTDDLKALADAVQAFSDSADALGKLCDTLLADFNAALANAAPSDLTAQLQAITDKATAEKAAIDAKLAADTPPAA